MRNIWINLWRVHRLSTLGLCESFVYDYTLQSLEIIPSAYHFKRIQLQSIIVQNNLDK
jgi:hypothetical protein